MNTKLAIRNDMELMQLGEILAASNYFSDAKSAAQAAVKVLAGQELGIGPFASMTGIHIIQGKPIVGAHLLAAKVKGSEKYDYTVETLDDEKCTIVFFENGQQVGKSIFTMDDAKEAGLTNKDNWRKYPRNQLFARTISNGVKWYCPDVTTSPVYTPDEFGLETDEEGNVIDGSFQTTDEVPVINQSYLKRWRDLCAEADMLGLDYPTIPDDATDETIIALGRDLADRVKTTKQSPIPQIARGTRTPDATIADLRKNARWEKDNSNYWHRQPDDQQVAPNPKDVQRAAALLGIATQVIGESKEANEARRHSLVEAIFGMSSLNDCTDAEVKALLAWAEGEKGTWTNVSENAQAEAVAILELTEPETETEIKTKALTWNDLADEYDEAHPSGPRARTLAMDAVFGWAKNQSDKYTVSPDGCIYKQTEAVAILSSIGVDNSDDGAPGGSDNTDYLTLV